MARLSDLPLTTRLFMKGYPFSRYTINPVPLAPLRRPLHQARLALVTTAGLFAPGQPEFDRTIKIGDSSFREISNELDPAVLTEGHRSKSFDHAGVAADRNLAFPLDRCRELVAQGQVGSLNHRHFSFMGSIVNPRQLIEETAPAVAQRLRQDQVDVVLLTPV